jgi:hypothetical protein
MDPRQQSREQSAVRLVAWTVVCLALFTIAVYIGYRYDITLWDWLKLLVVPAVIAGGGIWFNRQQRERELEIAERRTQDEALQAYLDQMASMLIPNTAQPSLYKARPGDRLSSAARARTLTMLPRLDGKRKARVVQFLLESSLIATSHPILAMSNADLREADLRGAHLWEAHLSRADLSGADLREANLSGAVLSGAVLSGANLQVVKGQTNEQLEGEAKSLERATMPDGQKYEEWLEDREDRNDAAENE